MRRILLLFVAMLLVLWGFSILGASAPAPAVALRDGLTVAVAGAILFAAAALTPIFPAVTRFSHPWATFSKIFLGLGTLLMLAGAVGLVLALRNVRDDWAIWALLAWGGGLLALFLAGFWPSRPSVQQDGDHWSLASARAFLVEANQRRAAESPALFGHATNLVVLILLTLLAAGLRIWNFAQLPDGCSAEACAAGVQALEFLRQDDWRALLAGDAPLYTLLTALIFGLFEPGIASLRWLGLCLGTLTVPLFYLAGREVVRPAAALLAALLLAFAPWHIALSRYPEPGLLLLALTFAAVWAYGWAANSQTGHRWLVAGLLAGLAALTMPVAFLPLLLLWWVAALPPASWRGRFLFWAALLLGSAPRLVALAVDFRLPERPAAIAEKLQAMATLLIGDGSLSMLLLATLALLGLAAVLRAPQVWATRFLWGGLLATLFFLSSETAITWTTLAPLLAILVLSTLPALDQLAGNLIGFWSPALAPVRMAAALAAVLLLSLAIGTVDGLTAHAQSAAFAAVRTDPGAGIGQVLNTAFETSVDNGGDNPDLYFVPQDLLNRPSLQLAAGGVLPFARRILPLDSVEHLPFVGPPFVDLPTDGDLHYVIPYDEPVLLNHIATIYSTLSADLIRDRASGQTLGYVISVPRSLADAVRGLTLRYSPAEAETDTDAVAGEPAGPLEFEWDEPPVPAPFTLEGEGALYVPESGQYSFQAETEPGAEVMVILGQAAQASVLIDTGAERTESEIMLDQGYYPLRIQYTSSDETPRLSVRWERPGGKLEPIPRQALYNIDAQNGLLVDYYAPGLGLAELETASPDWRRREPLLTATALLTESRSVVWQAKLAAPVDGIYELNVEANGRYQLFLDGNLLLGENSTILSRRSTTLQLRYGWHDLKIQYEAPPSAPRFQLRWQPAGAEGGLIPAQYFVPYLPDVDASALAVPEAPAPALIAVQPPGDAFDLPATLETTGGDLPGNLPELPLELQWQTGSCGPGDAQFQEPRGVAILPDRGQLFVADMGNLRLAVYDLATGAPAGVLTDERMLEPFDLGRNALGELFLLDAVAQQIFRVDPHAGLLTPLALETSFYRPRGLGVDIAGMLLVADTGGGRVVVLTPEGEVVTSVGGPDTPLAQGQPVDALSLPNGAIWVVTAEDGRLWRLDRGEGQAATAPANTFTAPHLAGLPNGAFLLTDPERRLLLYYTAEGQAAGQLGYPEFAKPAGIDAATGDGKLLVAVTDSVACRVSLWQMSLDALP